MRYEFSEHPELSGWFQVVDTKWMMVCHFEAHRFNETQVFPDYGHLPIDPDKIAMAMRELGDWLFSHHYSEIFPVPTFEIRRTDNDADILVIRHKTPQMVVSIPANEVNDLNEIASNLRKMAEFLNKRVKNFQ